MSSASARRTVNQSGVPAMADDLFEDLSFPSSPRHHICFLICTATETCILVITDGNTRCILGHNTFGRGTLPAFSVSAKIYAREGVRTPCEKSWDEKEIGCTKKSPSKSTFSVAKDYCSTQGFPVGWMAEPRTAEQLLDINEYAADTLWIGVIKPSGAAEYDFRYVSDMTSVKNPETGFAMTEKVWPPWSTIYGGQPNNAGGNQDCMQVQLDGGRAAWNDLPCGNLYHAMCQTKSICIGDGDPDCFP